jgi:hypothetical protein
MVMTMEDKKKCAEFYELFTGVHTEPFRWNEKAGDLLAKMIFKIKDCSHGMGLARAVWPSTSKVSWVWVVKLPLSIIAHRMKVNSGSVSLACLNAGVDWYEESISIALMK